VCIKQLNKITNSLLGEVLSLVAGMLLTLAFAPFGQSWLAVLSPALLLLLWLNMSPRRAFFRGWLFGIGLFSTGIYWVYISIHTYGNASVSLASFITISFIAFLALFPAANGYLLNRSFKENNAAKILLAFPTIWVILEWFRSFLFSGFPWLFIGSSQINTPLKGYAPLFSVYGVSLAVVLSSAFLVHFCIKRTYSDLGKGLFIWIIGGALTFITWTSPLRNPFPISLVQGNISQDVKWSVDQVQPTLDRYKALTEAHWQSKMIIWPEAAIPLTVQLADTFIDEMSRLAAEHHTTLITGVPMKVPDNEGYYNTIITLGQGRGIYLKRRLVPFGEYTPFPQVLEKILGKLDIPMSDFIPGKKMPEPLIAHGMKVSAFICYEIAFPEQVRNSDPDVGLILAVSNDAWFGHSVAQAQHLQIAQMRALEMGRPVLFVSNTGITAFIRSDGTVQSEAPPFTTTVLTDTVQARQGKTPWQRWGLDPMMLTWIVMLVMAFLTRKRDI